MRKRTIIAIIVAFVLSIGVSALWSAQSDRREGDPDANTIEDNGSQAGQSAEKKPGNKLGKIIGAPLRAIGHLFHHKDDKLQRMSDKDAARFESAATVRVDDARSDVKLKQLSANAGARDHFANGRALLMNGRLNEAISELSTSVSLDPSLTEAHDLLGIAYDRKGMPDRAKDEFNRAIHSAPEDAQALNNLGFSLYQNGNYRAAVDRLKRAAKLAPRDERILNNLALAQCRLGKYDEAYKNFARAAGELNGHLNTAVMLERAGRENDAIKHYEGALRVQSNSAVALRRLVDLYQRAGRSDRAEEARNVLARISSEVAVTTAGRE
jgi:Flp pilus assembly protein TadD